MYNGKDVNRPLIERIRALSRPLSPLPTGLAPQGRDPLFVAVVLFDVYGTLFISGSGDIGVRENCDRADALTDAVRAAGLKVLSSSVGEEGVRWLSDEIRLAHEKAKTQGVASPEVDIRLIWKSVLEKMQVHGLVKGSADEERVLLAATDYECRVNPVWPMPGLKELLENLRSRNVRMGLISNAQFLTPLLFPALLGLTLEEAGFDPALNVWSYAEGEAKPSVRLYERAADVLKQRYGVAASQVLYVGNDILNDIRPARQAGFRTALFAGDRRSLRLREDDPDCQGVEPDWVITELDQIRKCVQSCDPNSL